MRVNAPSRHSPDLRRRARRDNWQDGHDRPIGQASVNKTTARLPDLNRQLQARPQAFQPIPQPSHRRTRGSRTHNPCHHEGLVLPALASRQHRRFCRPHRLRRGGGSMSAVNLRVSGVGGLVLMRAQLRALHAQSRSVASQCAQLHGRAWR